MYFLRLGGFREIGPGGVNWRFPLFLRGVAVLVFRAECAAFGLFRGDWHFGFNGGVSLKTHILRVGRRWRKMAGLLSLRKSGGLTGNGESWRFVRNLGAADILRKFSLVVLC